MARSLKPQSLCKLSKSEIKEHFSDIFAATQHSKFLCVKCARSAQDKKWLCKPEKAH